MWGNYPLAAIAVAPLFDKSSEGAADGPIGRGKLVKHYRINKVTEPGGRTLKKRDVLAKSDREAVQRAEDSVDCPICEVLRDGQVVGIVD